MMLQAVRTQRPLVLRVPCRPIACCTHDLTAVFVLGDQPAICLPAHGAESPCLAFLSASRLLDS
jgi:hypothetical protein